MRHRDEQKTDTPKRVFSSAKEAQAPVALPDKAATGRFPPVGAGKTATGRFSAVGAAKAGTGRFPAAGLGKSATGRLPLNEINRGRTGALQVIREGERPGGGQVPLLERNKSGFAPLRVLGNLLYVLGFAGEYRLLQIWRVLRDGGVFLAQVLAWVFVSLFGWLGRLFGGLWHDIAAPFRRYRRRRSQLRRLRARAIQRAQKKVGTKTFFGVGVKSTFQLAANIAGILLPVAAAAVLLFTVYNVATMQYALEVNVNGEVLGYVTDQNVVESAKSLLRDRLKLARNQELADWQLAPQLTIARANTLTTPHQLVNNYLMLGAENPGDLVSATAVYVRGELFAATTEGERLKEYLDGHLERYRRDAQPNAVVSFVNAVECEPDNDGVFFVETVETYDDLVERLNQNLAEEVHYVSMGDLSLELIAYRQGVTLDELLLRNPQLRGSGAGYVPERDAVLMIERSKPILQVQVAVRETIAEPVPFQIESVETADRAKGIVVTVQAGVDGTKMVEYDRVYVDGELNRSEVVSETIVTPAQNQIDEVGTFVYNILDPESGGDGYVWPVPFAQSSSRGISGTHRGLDIAGDQDSPIFAANSGVVVSAEWHPSWGFNVVIEHADGLSTRYAHCSLMLVTVGQQVTRGEHIAFMGDTGYSFGTHLHLEFFTTGNMNDYFDPRDFVVPPEGFEYRW